MLTTTTNFDTYNDASAKTPLHVIEFDGLSTIYCDHLPSDATEFYKPYIVDISGLDQQITIQKGKSSIGSLVVTILDVNQSLSIQIANDATYFHRKKATLKSGYVGNAIADLLQESTGWVTDMKRSPDGLSWIFSITDPQKWLQKTIFRNATDLNPYYLSGNPIKIALSILTSSDSGTNSDYDLGDSDYGCGLDSDSVNISSMERVMGDRFWGQTHNLYFVITEKQKAKDFLEREIWQVLNCYPQIDGSGKFFIVPFAPPVATRQVQTFDSQVIIGNKMPSLDMNLSAMINEIDFQIDYDYTSGEFNYIYYYVNANSYENRGPSSDPLSIKSKGLKITMGTWSQPSHALEVINRRQQAVFARLAIPPIKISFDAFFSQRITEVGDIVPFSHNNLIDVETGQLGIDSRLMEVTNKKVNRRNGTTSFTFLDTGFTKDKYSVFSPYMTIVSASSGTDFVVSVSDALLFEEGWEAMVVDQYMNIKAASITILTIDTGTGAITCDDIGLTPSSGWHVQFAAYDDVTASQQNYAFMADSNDFLGASNDAAHLLNA